MPPWAEAVRSEPPVATSSAPPLPTEIRGASQAQHDGVLDGALRAKAGSPFIQATAGPPTQATDR